MGKKVAALAKVAEHYVHSSQDSSSLSGLVAKQFPWWNASTLPYFPWKYKSWSERSFSDLKLFGPRTGIVMCVGSGNVREAAHAIVQLRNVHKSKLPIDIAYIGNGDLTPKVRTFLSSLGENVHFIDLTEVFDDNLIHLWAYASKPFALLASRYPRTILMDADAVFFSKPDTLFRDYPSLRETGALFFHDRGYPSGDMGNRRNWVTFHLKAAGRQPSAHLNRSSLFYQGYIGEEADASVVCIDKSRAKIYLAMVFACWMNVAEVRDAVTWRQWWYEKESYWLAAEFSGAPYSFEPWSSARFAQSQPSGVELFPNDHPEVDQNNRVRMRRRVPGLKSSKEDADGKNKAPPADRRCTAHMVHSNPSGREPLFANAGLWLDKHDIGLGLANWTHWYLGHRIDKVISDYAAASTSTPDDSSWEEADEKNDSLDQRSRQEMIMDTQPAWLQDGDDWERDEKGCPQHDERLWRKLSPGFRRRIADLIEEVRRVEARMKDTFG